jgi:hypothetical protein
VYRNHTLAVDKTARNLPSVPERTTAMSAPTDRLPSPLFQPDELDAISTFVLLLADDGFNAVTALSLLEGAKDDYAVRLHDRMVQSIFNATGYLNNHGTPSVSRPEGIVKAAPSFKTFLNLFPMLGLMVPDSLIEELETISQIALRRFYEDKGRAAKLHDAM